MKRNFVIAAFSVLSFVIPMTAQNARTFYLASAAVAGDVQLPRGICEVAWNASAGSRVQLTIKTEDQKTRKVVARMIEGNQGKTGVVTTVVDGVTYLRELHTANATFIIQSARKASK